MSRVWRGGGAALFLVVFLVFGATAARTDAHLDFWSAEYASWHLVETGTPWLDDAAVPHLDDNPERDVWVQDPAPNGHTVISRAPGVIAAGLPAYFLVHADHMTLVPGALTAALLAAVSVLLMFLALRTRLSRREALLAAGALAFATPVWTISANGLWPHTITGVGIAGMAWAAATNRSWLVGWFGGLALWGRLHAAVIVAVVGLWAGLRGRSVTLIVRAATPSLILLLGLSLWCRWMYGSWSPMAAYRGASAVAGAAPSHVDPVNHLGMWFAPDRGIFVWTPVLLVLLPALVRSWQDLPAWSRDLLVGGLVYTFVQTALITFTGGDYFYGYRLGLEFVLCATPAFAFSAGRAGAVARPLIGPLLALQTFAMSLGALHSALFVDERRVWVDNAFVHALWDTRPASFVVAVGVVMLGWWGQRVWTGTPMLMTNPPAHDALQPTGPPGR